MTTSAKTATAAPVFTIARTYSFESAHFLPKVPEGHRCRNLHGHNYRVEIIVAAPLDDRGFVMDFAEIDDVVKPLIAAVDHKLLNDVPGLENPTAEIIALWFCQRVATATRVRVYENDHSWAEVSKA
jgi:6-pyruvoyltetrahydropterin/6-carboxytetrahydropterin synthase